MDRNILSFPISRFENGRSTGDQDFLSVEEPLQISLAGREVAITMRTPGHDQELAAGFLFSEGFLQDPGQVVSIVKNDKGVVDITLPEDAAPVKDWARRNFYVTSSCGVCGRASIEGLKDLGCPPLFHDSLRVNSALIASLAEKMRASQAAFDRTGGLHAAALFDASSGELLIVREDVGRHNAVDKVVGCAFLRKLLPLEGHILLLSGRVSFELVQKALMAGIPIVAAMGAPSSLAVETARRFGMTLTGFMRNRTFNVYCGAQRIDTLHNGAQDNNEIPD